MPKPKTQIIEPIDGSLDEVSSVIIKEKSIDSSLPKSPFAKWKGFIDLGDDPVDCYVLDTKQRVISLRAMVKAIANADSGDLAKFIGVSALKPFINKDLVLAELIEFSIPGTQFKGLGLTTEHFETICRGYVQALHKGAPLTDRQREIAIQCAVLTSGLTRTGLDALIDEATGYQYDRKHDALRILLNQYVAEGMQKWMKMFGHLHVIQQKIAVQISQQKSV